MGKLVFKVTHEDVSYWRAKGRIHCHAIDLLVQLAIKLEKLVSSVDFEESGKLIRL